MDLQQIGDTELFDGMQKGGEEMTAWLNDVNNIPLGWSTHVLNDEGDELFCF
jgi:hypothetical protein